MKNNNDYFSDKVGEDATRDFEETLVEDERNLQLRQEEVGIKDGDSLGPGKENRNKMAEIKERISGLSAVRKAMKNGEKDDMFTEHMFQEKFMVNELHSALHVFCLHLMFQ